MAIDSPGAGRLTEQVREMMVLFYFVRPEESRERKEVMIGL